jgi:hypothetical protein
VAACRSPARVRRAGGRSRDTPGSQSFTAAASRALAPERKIPVLINEDDHNDFADPQGRLQACIAAHVSWGWFDWRRKGESFEEGYQSIPTNWGLSSERKRALHAKVAEITGAR